MEYAVSFACSLTCMLIMVAFLNVCCHMAYSHFVKKDAPWWVIVPIGILCFILSLGLFFAFKALYLYFFSSGDSSPAV